MLGQRNHTPVSTKRRGDGCQTNIDSRKYTIYKHFDGVRKFRAQAALTRHLHEAVLVKDVRLSVKWRQSPEKFRNSRACAEEYMDILDSSSQQLNMNPNTKLLMRRQERALLVQIVTLGQDRITTSSSRSKATRRTRRPYRETLDSMTLAEKCCPLELFAKDTDSSKKIE